MTTLFIIKIFFSPLQLEVMYECAFHFPFGDFDTRSVFYIFYLFHMIVHIYSNNLNKYIIVEYNSFIHSLLLFQYLCPQ